MKDKQHSAATIIWGLALVGVGIGYLGNNFGWWSGFTLFFAGWWSLFLILPCLTYIIDHGPKSVPIIGLIIGCLLLLSAQAKSLNLGGLIIPFCLIAVGIVIILRNSLFKYRRIVNAQTGESVSIPVYNCIFNSRTIVSKGERFDGASVTTVFGGLSLDISNTLIENDVIIDVTTIFAGAYIKLPSNVNVKVTASPALGTITNHLTERNLPGAPTVFITGTCVFAGTDVR